MKRLLILLMTAAMFLTGCSYEDPSEQGGKKSEPRAKYHRYIEYRNSALNFDPYNRVIEIKEGYMLDESHSYDVVDTNDGYDIVLHFIREKN